MMNCPRCDCYCPPEAEACSCGYRFPANDLAPASPYAKQKKAALAFFDRVAGSKRQLFRLALLVSLGLWILSLLFIKSLPGTEDIFPQLLDEPRQNRESIPPPFRVKKTS